MNFYRGVLAMLVMAPWAAQGQAQTAGTATTQAVAPAGQQQVSPAPGSAAGAQAPAQSGQQAGSGAAGAQTGAQGSQQGQPGQRGYGQPGQRGYGQRGQRGYGQRGQGAAPGSSPRAQDGGQGGHGGPGGQGLRPQPTIIVDANALIREGQRANAMEEAQSAPPPRLSTPAKKKPGVHLSTSRPLPLSTEDAGKP